MLAATSEPTRADSVGSQWDETDAASIEPDHAADADNIVRPLRVESTSGSFGARPGHTYLTDLGPGAHVIQLTGGEK
jgi:hypothetical protein